MASDSCRVLIEETKWHGSGLKKYYTYEHTYIGSLTLQEMDGTPWVYAKKEDAATPIALDAEIRPDGFILREKGSQRTVTRSGDWLVLKETDNEDDTVLQWWKSDIGMGYHAKFKSGGSWVCTSGSGELNVKNSGDKAVFWHDGFFSIPV